MIIRSFGNLSNGGTAGLYILRNKSGMTAAVSNYGASLVSLYVPDKYGKMLDVVLGYDDAAGYENGSGCIGGTIGRVANRIGGGSFTLNGKEYQLTVNNGDNTLHGGRDPFHKRLWDVRIPFSKVDSGDLMYAVASESISDGSSTQAKSNLEDKMVTFCLDSPDGDQGFPGNLHLEVSYRLTDSNSLVIEYNAVSDADTPIGFTNHSYFNLNGHNRGTVLQHIAEIKADYFTPSDSGLLPTGAVQDVSGTPMDFRVPKMLGADINSDYDAIRLGGGYDHNYVVCGYPDGKDIREFREIAALMSHDSGITMNVLTDMPGVQLYTANGLHGQVGKDGSIYEPRSGVCFETQVWPDTINKKNFPGGILRAGETFTSKTEYKFSV